MELSLFMNFYWTRSEQLIVNRQMVLVACSNFPPFHVGLGVDPTAVMGAFNNSSIAPCRVGSLPNRMTVDFTNPRLLKFLLHTGRLGTSRHANQKTRIEKMRIRNRALSFHQISHNLTCRGNPLKGKHSAKN